LSVVSETGERNIVRKIGKSSRAPDDRMNSAHTRYALRRFTFVVSPRRIIMARGHETVGGIGDDALLRPDGCFLFYQRAVQTTSITDSFFNI